MATEEQKCPKCGNDMVRKGITKEDGKIIKHMRCHTCGHELKVALG